jgi:hypothetical protein
MDGYEYQIPSISSNSITLGTDEGVHKEQLSKPPSEVSIRILNSIIYARVPESNFYRDALVD